MLDKSERCEESVLTPGLWHHYHQCTRKRGFGPKGKFCKQHSPEAVAERQRKATERYEAKSARFMAPYKELTRLREIERLAGELAAFIDSIGPNCMSESDYRSGAGMTFGEWYSVKSAARTLKAKIEESHD